VNRRDLQPLQVTPPSLVRPDLDAIKRMRMEMGTTSVELAAERLENARPELIEAMKSLDTTEDRDLHVRVGKVVNDLDDVRVLLAGRNRS
jgi:hypothetical protein